MIKELETIAIHGVALKDPEYFTRKVYRYYSQKFHTPLMDAYKLPWGFVLTNYLEHIVESNNTREEVYELAVDICYPELKDVQEEVINDRIRELENQNIQAGFGKNPKKEKAKEIAKIEKEKAEQLNPHNEEKEINMGEGMFSHLEEEMEEGNE
jgi:short subunit dehydrogenase-like uncharacterized protein